MGKLLDNDKGGIITREELGKRIKALRIWRGYKSRTEFAHLIGINLSTITGYEFGESAPSYVGLVRLADFLNVTIDQLLALEPIPNFDTTGDELQTRRTSLHDCYVDSPENARILDTVVSCLNDKHDTEKAMDALAAVMDVTRPCLSHDACEAG